MVPSTPSLGGMYLKIHFTHQIQEIRKISVTFPICHGVYLAYC
ncbi:Similarity (fragment) [Microcystis aeruginosa PCC 9432]|uniref:Similarity n=2 Tax=Microcystis aeruginosa TaxID=1126 RepID=A0A822LCD6_MICAE